MAGQTKKVTKKKVAAKAAESEMTNEQAAALVKRTVPVMKDGKPTKETKQVAVKADEVLDFKDHGDHVVVVTVDGKKLRGDK